MSPDPVIWGFKAIKPFDAEHPIGSGTLVHYNPGDEVPASEWGRAEGFMVEAGTIMRYARNVAEVPGQIIASESEPEEVEETEETTEEDGDEPVEEDAPEETETTPDDDEPPAEEGDAEATAFPVKVESGYQLSDGNIVAGKARAIAAQAELDVAKESVAA